MSRQALLSGRILRRHDQYQDWRLDVDNMSYEVGCTCTRTCLIDNSKTRYHLVDSVMQALQQELLHLGDKIGYVGTGLQEEEISTCLTKFNHFHHDSTSSLPPANHKDFKCSICQVHTENVAIKTLLFLSPDKYCYIHDALKTCMLLDLDSVMIMLNLCRRDVE